MNVFIRVLGKVSISNLLNGKIYQTFLIYFSTPPLEGFNQNLLYLGKTKARILTTEGTADTGLPHEVIPWKYLINGACTASTDVVITCEDITYLLF